MKYRPRFIGFETSITKHRKNEKNNDIADVTAAAFTGSGSIA